MLSNEVRNFLTGIIPDQAIDVYVRFINFLSEKEIFTSYYYVMELIATKDTYEKVTFSMKLNDIFASQVDAILADFDISLTDEITVYESLKFLEAFFLIEHWEDQERLQSLINNAETTEIALADIISEISSIPSDEILPWLKSVSPVLIENISNLTKSQDDESYIDLLPDDYEHYEKVKHKVKSFIAEKKEETNIPAFLEEFGIRLLTPIEQLLEDYIGTPFCDLSQFDNVDNPLLMRKKVIDQMSDNFVGLGLVSGITAEELITATANKLPMIALPERVVTELLVQVREKSNRLNYND